MVLVFNDLIVPVILAGGKGTRLWPMSRSQRPKQFLALTGDVAGDGEPGSDHADREGADSAHADAGDAGARR